MSDSAPSSPPGPGTSPEESLKFYKAQYELLEAELAEFQSSSKDLEAELEKDIEAAEKRERKLKDKATNLQYEVDEWKEKYRSAKNEVTAAQNVLQKEVTQLREDNRHLQLKLRDIEVANDDFERQQRHTESSLEDMQQQYNQAFEKAILFEQEVQKVEQERENLRIDVQRLKDEYQDFKIEADITREKLKKAEESLKRRSNLSIDPTQSTMSPRSELSPTTTNTSTPSFDTPPAKTASSSGISDTPTPPSPPISEKSATSGKPLTTPQVAKPRVSMNTTPRQPTYTSKPPTHNRGLSSAVTIRTGPAYRQSLSKSTTSRQSALPQSSSIMQLRNLRGKMQNLEQRVQKARSRLPAPIDTPPRASPRSGSAIDAHIPSSVTVRSRKRTTGSNVGSSVPDSDVQSTPSLSRTRSSRQSLTQQFKSAQTSPSRQLHTQQYKPSQTSPPRHSLNQQYKSSQTSPPRHSLTQQYKSSQTSPSRHSLTQQFKSAQTSPSRSAMPPPRPSSRASGVSSRNSNFVPSHSRPGSRASVSNVRAPLGSGVGSMFAPNASTDRVTTRPHSSLSDYQRATKPSRAGYDGSLDEEEDSFFDESSGNLHSATATTPTPRRNTIRARTSDVSVNSGIPSPVKRQSLSTIGGIGLSGGSSLNSSSRLPGPTRRQSHSNLHSNTTPTPSTSLNFNMSVGPGAKPPSRTTTSTLDDVKPKKTSYDINETF